ncbi:hypothetical protein [Gynurincola endophyticus]|uniref:hypothetical protein n=1 Tax=Gynurincola endophyticus TaxID=2479004 RepID=UPI000F8DEE55|nr:hypothetical protein [Gynurincola endophyticus]
MKFIRLILIPVFFMYSCGNAQIETIAVKNAGNIQCAEPKKIEEIYPEWVYDLSGYKGVNGGDPYFLFDESKELDPLNGINGSPNTNPHPKSGGMMYFKPGIGSRIVVDLGTDYDISSVFLYDKSSSGDSISIYSGSPLEWTLHASFLSNKSSFGGGWKRLDIQSNTRFVMIQFAGPANITEMVLYGCRTGAAATAPAKKYEGARLPQKSLKEFLGVNCYQGTPMQYMTPFTYSRLYMNNDKIDIGKQEDYPDNIRYNIVPNGWWNNGTGDYVLYDDSVKMVKQKIWYSFLGVPKWLMERGGHNHDFPLTQPGMPTHDPKSYGRHANMLWNMAAAYGATKVDTNLIQAVNSNRFSGRNTMTVFENGNESDAYWEGMRYWTPLEYFAMSSADYDGHEGALGARHGIKNADQKSELMMAGLVGIDFNRVRVLDFLSRYGRKDQQFLWNGGIQFHYYSNNGKGELAGDKFSSAKAGITPEEDSLRTKLSRVREQTYLLQPEVECILGEYGFDKNQQSKVSAPIIDQQSPEVSQGVVLLRAINAIFFSGFDQYIIYWIKDTEPLSTPNTYLTSGLLKQDPGQVYSTYPSWHHIDRMVQHLGEYIPESVVSEQGDVWVYKYKHKSQPQQKAYFVYQPVRDSKKNISYNLKSSAKTGHQIDLVSDQVSSVAASGGQFKLPVSANPTIFMVEER